MLVFRRQTAGKGNKGRNNTLFFSSYVGKAALHPCETRFMVGLSFCCICVPSMFYCVAFA